MRLCQTNAKKRPEELAQHFWRASAFSTKHGKALHKGKERGRCEGRKRQRRKHEETASKRPVNIQVGTLSRQFCRYSHRIPIACVDWLCLFSCRLLDGVHNGSILHCFGRIGQSVSNLAASILPAGLNTTHCHFCVVFVIVSSSL